jgi:polyhydroxyalkanoate synthesis repressor PhaR
MAKPPLKTTRTPAAKKVSVRTKAKLEEKPSVSETDTDGQDLRVIKKYPNRRLYDTKHSTYITLFDIKGLVMSGESFVVLDAKTGEELTRNILMQIILEEESSGMPLLSTQSLLQMIRFYGNSLQGMMAPYMEQNLNQFIDLQNQYIAHCQKVGSLSSPETWLKFMNNKANTEVVNPMRFLMNAGTQFWEQMQQNPTNLITGFPFQSFKK